MGWLAGLRSGGCLELQLAAEVVLAVLVDEVELTELDAADVCSPLVGSVEQSVVGWLLVVAHPDRTVQLQYNADGPMAGAAAGRRRFETQTVVVVPAGLDVLDQPPPKMEVTVQRWNGSVLAVSDEDTAFGRDVRFDAVHNRAAAFDETGRHSRCFDAVLNRVAALDELQVHCCSKVLVGLHGTRISPHMMSRWASAPHYIKPYQAWYDS
jgi:hypothetical protein